MLVTWEPSQRENCRSVSSDLSPEDEVGLTSTLFRNEDEKVSPGDRLDGGQPCQVTVSVTGQRTISHLSRIQQSLRFDHSLHFSHGPFHIRTPYNCVHCRGFSSSNPTPRIIRVVQGKTNGLVCACPMTFASVEGLRLKCVPLEGVKFRFKDQGVPSCPFRRS